MLTCLLPCRALLPLAFVELQRARLHRRAGARRGRTGCFCVTRRYKRLIMHYSVQSTRVCYLVYRRSLPVAGYRDLIDINLNYIPSDYNLAYITVIFGTLQTHHFIKKKMLISAEPSFS